VADQAGSPEHLSRSRSAPTEPSQVGLLGRCYIPLATQPSQAPTVQTHCPNPPRWRGGPGGGCLMGAHEPWMGGYGGATSR
jgi:hypothetical protein